MLLPFRGDVFAMTESPDLEALADACLAAHAAVIEWGTPEMQVAAAALLLLVGRELANPMWSRIRRKGDPDDQNQLTAAIH